MQTSTNQTGRPPELAGAVSAATESAARAEFGTFPKLRADFSIPRSTAYELEKLGEIQFVRLRRRGNVKGRVLVNLDSVRAYLSRCAGKAA